MKRKTLILSSTALAAALGAALLFSTPGQAFGPKGQGYYGGGPMAAGFGGGPCMKGDRAGYGYGHHGKRGWGKGRGYGPGFGGQVLDKELTTDDVKKFIEGRLAWRGNDRLKVGAVTEKDDNTIIAEIVTVDNSLVWKVEVDRRTGQHRPVK